VEKKVQLELTVQELQALVDMTAIAGTVLQTPNVLSELERPLPHEGVAQKIYALSAEVDPGSGVQFSEEHQGCLETDDYLETGIPAIAIPEFRSEIFWDELVEELAARDIALTMGDEFFEMTDEERVDIMEQKCKLYGDEFQGFGLARLWIDESVLSEMPDFDEEETEGESTAE
jgi:hypothetical protein